jgi:O-acetyl-ADP-ribose deacetylase (regulator of RNase III)
MQIMKLILVAPVPGLCDAWREFFKDLSDVEIVNDKFENVPEFDCMVSAANSFGLMDGGVDLAIIRFFGQGLERAVQNYIVEEFLGEQPVGTSFIIETGHPQHPFLAHTPTMRVPMSISRTDNAYKAMWSMLLAVRQHNKASERKIDSILCPGLGTGTGGVPFRQAARQMALAYKNFLKPPPYITWQFADQRQAEIRYGGDDGCNFPPEYA